MGKHSVTIPFRLERGLIVFDVLLEGESLSLILDTGCESMLLFPSSRKYFRGKAQVNQVSFSGLGNRKRVNGNVHGPVDLRFGGMQGRNFYPVLIDLPQNSGFQRIADGVIGYQLFYKFKVEIDYSSRVIRLHKDINQTQLVGFKEIPLEIDDAKPYVTAITQNNKGRRDSLRLLIDTGSAFKLSLIDPKLQASKSITVAEGLSGKISGYHDAIPFININDLILENLEVVIFGSNAFFSDVEVNRSGSIGGSFFEGFRLIFDYNNKKLLISA